MESLAATPSSGYSAAEDIRQIGSASLSLVSALVLETDNGFPCSIAIGKRTVAVAGVIQPFPGVAAHYQVGDTVMIADTDHGVMVYGAAQLRNAPAAARVAVADERVVIDARGIKLQSENATVELLNDGKIRITSQRLLAVSKGPTTVKGSIIELN